ncbi:MAG: hypothetical protein ACLPSL_16225 [Smithella sp.]
MAVVSLDFQHAFFKLEVAHDEKTASQAHSRGVNNQGIDADATQFFRKHRSLLLIRKTGHHGRAAADQPLPRLEHNNAKGIGQGLHHLWCFFTPTVNDNDKHVKLRFFSCLF